MLYKNSIATTIISLHVIQLIVSLNKEPPEFVLEISVPVKILCFHRVRFMCCRFCRSFKYIIDLHGFYSQEVGVRMTVLIPHSSMFSAESCSDVFHFMMNCQMSRASIVLVNR
jgi:hypothetical protein